jgi:hypothetical protein
MISDTKGNTMDATTEPVYKTAKCKRCNSKTVAWQTSKKTGRYYLTEVFRYDGEDRTDHRDFHSAYCADTAGSEGVARHAAKQDAIIAAEFAREQDAKREKAAKDSDLRRAEHTASEMVLGWYQMSIDEIHEQLPTTEAELAEEERRLAVETAPANRYTMDDFHEQNKQLGRIAAHKSRIRLLTAERDVLKARLENES